jgi:hypothetical protein
MIDLTQRSALGDTAAEFIEFLDDEIGSEGEGLWTIVPAGRSFGYNGAELQEFVHRCIMRILNAGGVPVRHSEQGSLRWVEQA